MLILYFVKICSYTTFTKQKTAMQIGKREQTNNSSINNFDRGLDILSEEVEHLIQQ